MSWVATSAIIGGVDCGKRAVAMFPVTSCVRTSAVWGVAEDRTREEFRTVSCIAASTTMGVDLDVCTLGVPSYAIVSSVELLP